MKELVLLEHSLPPIPFVQINKPLLDKLLDYCVVQAPEEACGVLLGYRHKSNMIVVEQYMSIRNTSPSPQGHFEMDPEVWIPLLLSAETQVVGIFHSHPQSGAYPSEEDKRIPWDFPTYWIVSLHPGEQTRLRCYSLEGPERWREQHLMLNNG